MQPHELIWTLTDATFAGELIGPDHPDYDTARKVFNGVVDKRPALIVQVHECR